MKVLAFDTSFSACSAAIVAIDADAGNTWLADCGEPPGLYEPMVTGQAPRLVPMIDEVMDDAGVSFGDLSGIATGCGPGTFTGSRIAVSTARAFGLATGLPTYDFSTLCLMNAKARFVLGERYADHVFAVCVDARRGDLYVQLYKPASRAPVGPVQLVTANDVLAMCQGEAVVGVGTGAPMVAAAFEQCCEGALPSSFDVELPDLQPDARFASRVVLEPRSPLKPLYLRAPDAKPQAEKLIARL